MADRKITDLQLRSNVNDDVNVPVDDGIQTYRTTGPQWKAYLKPVYVSPWVQRFKTPGSGTYNKSYAFFVSGANATVGATYTNNAITFTVLDTISGGALLRANGSGAPSASGTLTKTGGTGDSTIAFSEYKAPTHLRVKMAGAGGSGGNFNGAIGINGLTGDDSTFGSSLLIAGGGEGGNYPSTSDPKPQGGTNIINSPAIEVLNLKGNVGQIGVTAAGGSGGPGGNNPMFGGGGDGSCSNNGSANLLDATDNTGGGGGGGSTSNANNTTGGASGGALEAIIPNPSATYSYVVADTTLLDVTSGVPSGLGGSGIIIVEECFQ